MTEPTNDPRCPKWETTIEPCDKPRTLSVVIEDQLRPSQKSFHRPNILYTYMASKWAVANVVTLQLKLCDPSKTNDYLEFVWNLRSDKDSVQYRKEYSSKYNFLSLCQDPDNLLLWSYYADRSKGICLGLSTALEHDFDDLLWPVQYSGTVDPFADKTRIEHNPEEVELIKRLFTTKRRIWEHEDEWRLIVPTNSPRVKSGPDGLRFFDIHPDELKEVYFGTNCAAIDIGRMALACLKIGATPSFYKMEENLDLLQLDSTRCDLSMLQGCMHIALLNGTTF